MADQAEHQGDERGEVRVEVERARRVRVEREERLSALTMDMRNG